MNGEKDPRPADDTRAANPQIEPKHVCPLLSAGMIAGVGKNRSLPCMGSECAWWNAKAGQCVVLSGRIA